MAIEGTLLQWGLGAAGIPDNVIKDIEKDMPNFARLCRNAKLLSPIANAAFPLIKQLMPKLSAIGDAPVKEALPMIADLSPIIDQLTPLYQQAAVIVTPEQDDINTVTPVILELVDFINKKNTNALGSGVE
jgi:hypothetical protein